MIPVETIQAMISRRALLEDTPGKYTIDFWIIKNEFPAFLEQMVLQLLSDLERDLYLEGFMAYIVREDGRLHWKPTGRKFPE